LNEKGSGTAWKRRLATRGTSEKPAASKPDASGPAACTILYGIPFKRGDDVLPDEMEQRIEHFRKYIIVYTNGPQSVAKPWNKHKNHERQQIGCEGTKAK
jgi:hypothetical protein